MDEDRKVFIEEQLVRAQERLNKIKHFLKGLQLLNDDASYYTALCQTAENAVKTAQSEVTK